MQLAKYPRQMFSYLSVLFPSVNLFFDVKIFRVRD